MGSSSFRCTGSRIGYGILFAIVIGFSWSCSEDSAADPGEDAGDVSAPDTLVETSNSDSQLDTLTDSSDETIPEVDDEVVVASVTPVTATLNELTEFTITGANLPDTLVAWIAECEGLTYDSKSSTEVKFSCTPSWNPGEKEVQVKDAPGGSLLHEGTLTVGE